MATKKVSVLMDYDVHRELKIIEATSEGIYGISKVIKKLLADNKLMTNQKKDK